MHSSPNDSLMLITKEIENAPQGGRQLLCKLNFESLHHIYGESLFLFELPTIRLGIFKSILGFFRGHIDGLNKTTIRQAINIIKCNNVKSVFVDGSNLGGFVSSLKKELPDVKVITFFHNVEFRFFWGSFISRKNLRSLALVVANYFSERRAVQFSDKIVCLSFRDSHLLNAIYGRYASYISPISLEDKLPVDFFNSIHAKQERFAIFVGGAFYANIDGIKWFVREIVPQIDMPIYIIGKGFEAFKNDLEVPGKVKVVGTVDSLADWYHRANFVIAPIFDGSGMKTKVAEALMFGKKVVGTPEAFSGYEEIVDQAGWVCRTADEFVAAIKIAQIDVTSSFDMTLRELYLKQYSLVAAQQRLRTILLDPV